MEKIAERHQTVKDSVDAGQVEPDFVNIDLPVQVIGLQGDQGTKNGKEDDVNRFGRAQDFLEEALQGTLSFLRLPILTEPSVNFSRGLTLSEPEGRVEGSLAERSFDFAPTDVGASLRISGSEISDPSF